jgi:hypothetical protein
MEWTTAGTAINVTIVRTAISFFTIVLQGELISRGTNNACKRRSAKYFVMASESGIERLAVAVRDTTHASSGLAGLLRDGHYYQ